MLFVCYPKCTTCQKAKAWLEARGLALKDKLPGMSEDEQFALLATDGMLVKRPILVGEDFVLVGFREAEWAARLG